MAHAPRRRPTCPTGTAAQTQLGATAHARLYNAKDKASGWSNASFFSSFSSFLLYPDRGMECLTTWDTSTDARDAETWLANCYPKSGQACCLQGADTCCNDTSSIHFEYKPGTVIAVLDSNGDNLLATGTSSPTATATPGGTGASSADTSSAASPSSGSQASNTSAAEIALGVVLGFVVLASGIGATTLWVKLRSEKRVRRQMERELAAARGSFIAQQSGPLGFKEQRNMTPRPQSYTTAMHHSSNYPLSELATVEPHELSHVRDHR